MIRYFARKCNIQPPEKKKISPAGTGEKTWRWEKFFRLEPGKKQGVGKISSGWNRVKNMALGKFLLAGTG